MQSQKPKLLLLSDLWGFRHDQWRRTFEKVLSDKYQVCYLDSTIIAGIPENITRQKTLHKAFLEGGIEIAVQYLLDLKETYATIIGVSIGGTIAWQALLKGFSARHFIAISATRLRHEHIKPDCLIDLYYGTEDPFKPDKSWAAELQLKANLFSGEGHHIYSVPTIVQQILNTSQLV